MSVMYMLIAFSLLIASGFLLAFIWAMRNGQYEDKYTPSVRILFDDEPRVDSTTDSEEKTSTKSQHTNKS
ncbi:MAG: cbb3-type cytochrome oxidase assembly protein CcoS [Balneolia bacterium]|nr:cbb3-type cytochrome oxidase assembly protein CcoS [Balneolia bacterium]